METSSLLNIISARLADAVAQVAGEPRDPIVRPAQDPRFGDYQCNVAMGLAKALGSKPRDIAARIVEAVQLDDLAEPLEIAGPGFINIRLKPAALADYLAAIPAPLEPEGDDRLGMPPVESPRRVVIDYSCPNIAKQMHVGHLRSTVIGDVFARVLGCEGHEVVRQNHVGDWGTQFGMLIEYYRENPLPQATDGGEILDQANRDYKAAQARFESDPEFASAARLAVARLQGGDPQARATWQQLCDISRVGFSAVYDRLGVLLTDDDVRGESFYNEQLPDVVAELRRTLAPGQSPRAEVREDQGAVCVFLHDEQGQPAYKGAEGQPLPMIIQKSDGAYLYATTDLAALRYRIRTLGAGRIIYVTDSRQKLHFQMLFDTARAAGWATGVTLEHVTFGTVLGEDRRPLKTRSGETVRLRDLLDEAERRAYDVLMQREAAGDEDVDAATSEPEKQQIARAVGIAAVKYADLSRDRTTDYVFNWDQMLAFQGNTAPYMMYAYARIRSIYRKAAERFGAPDVYAGNVSLALDHELERALALRLARFRETLDSVASDLLPHVLCGYLFDAAQDFSRFYEACSVLGAPDEATRLSRMRLCDLTARTLRLGLGLLGIPVIERM